MSNLDYALRYLAKGLSVIPLWSPDLSTEEIKADPKAFITRCKTPLIPTWSPYQKRLPTEKEIKTWFTDYPTSNIGIVTGKVSGIMVVDIDDQEKAKALIEEIGGFPETVKAKTSKGWHLYFRCPGFEVRSSANRALGIDIRAEGGFVVAPPSIHGSGFQYAWEKGYSPEERELAECPIKLLEILSTKTQPITHKNKPAVKQEVKKDEVTINEYAILLQSRCQEGERNVTATKLIGHFLRLGVDDQEVLELMRLWNAKNQPPLTDQELTTVLASIQKTKTQQIREVNIDDFLITPERLVQKYSEKVQRKEFAGDNLNQLQTRLGGGLVGGRIYLLGGIPSCGKTTLINCLADNLCLQGHTVMFFSYDDDQQDLWNRTIARFVTGSIKNINQGVINPKDIANNQSLKKIFPLKHIIEASVPIEEWDDYLEQFRVKGKPSPVVFIDYLRKIHTKKNFNEERLRVDYLVTHLSDLAKKYDFPMLVISELSREFYRAGQKISMASLKETGRLEYEASWLGILAVVEEKKGNYILVDDWEKLIRNRGQLDLVVLKSKRGLEIRAGFH